MKNENLENQIRNKLGQRSIKPSLGAWQNLEYALDQRDMSPTKKSRNWYYLFCLLLFVGASLSYFMMNHKIHPSSELKKIITITEPAGFAQESNIKNEESPIIETIEINSDKFESARKNETNNTNYPKLIKNNQLKNTYQQKSIESIESKDVEELDQYSTNSIVENGKPTAEFKNEELIFPEQTVVDSNVLQIAVKINKSRKIKVNTSKLLETAILEENSSFFSKVVFKLNKKSQEAITFLAERNFEN